MNSFLINHSGKISLILAIFVPAIFTITFALSFGDYFDTDPVKESQFRAQQALNAKIGLICMGITFTASVGFAIYAIKRERVLSVFSLLLCLGYLFYVIKSLF